MKIAFFLAAPFRKKEYINQLRKINDRFARQLGGIKNMEIKINLIPRINRGKEPKLIITISEDKKNYKVKLNFYRLYAGNLSLNIPGPSELYEKINMAIERIVAIKRLA